VVQPHLADSRVVKACNNIVFHHLLTLARPSHSPERSALPIASNSDDAKKQVAHFLNVVGYDAVDIGTLSDGWRSEPNTQVYGKPYMPTLRLAPGGDASPRPCCILRGA
jgi:8-hydroxy-5-deazaflavin:NADPH oxidoreductase